MCVLLVGSELDDLPSIRIIAEGNLYLFDELRTLAVRIGNSRALPLQTDAFAEEAQQELGGRSMCRHRERSGARSRSINSRGNSCTLYNLSAWYGT